MWVTEGSGSRGGWFEKLGLGVVGGLLDVLVTGCVDESRYTSVQDQMKSEKLCSSLGQRSAVIKCSQQVKSRRWRRMIGRTRESKYFREWKRGMAFTGSTTFTFGSLDPGPCFLGTRRNGTPSLYRSRRK